MQVFCNEIYGTENSYIRDQGNCILQSIIASYTRINSGKIDQVDRMLTKDKNITEKSV